MCAMAAHDRETGAAASTEPGLAPIRLKRRIEILPGTPLPEFDTATARAFAAMELSKTQQPLVALISDGRLPLRLDAVKAATGRYMTGVLRVADWGKVFWDADGAERYVVVYERPVGGRLMSDLSASMAAMPQEQVIRRLVSPVQTGLSNLAERDIVHGNVRPDNIYLIDAKGEHLALGPWVESPPGQQQPVMFEPFPYSYANPTGRGAGSADQDLYALGVTALIAMRGAVPLAGMSDQQIRHRKMELGSFAALAGDIRLPQTSQTLLRGLLNDRPEERWSIQELGDFLTEHRARTPRERPPKQARSGLKFNGEAFHTFPRLAEAMHQAVPAAAKLIHSGELSSWLHRAFSDFGKVDAVDLAIQQTSGQAANPADEDSLLVARVTATLDPEAPIRYKDWSVMPDGLGPVLVERVDSIEGRTTFAEILTSGLPQFRAGLVEDAGDVGLNPPNFERLSGHLRKKFPGYGVERCLYELNPTLRCMSPQLQNHCVTRIDELLPALEEVAGTGRLIDAIDRHIAAFIGARARENFDADLKQLADQSQRKTVLIATIRILAVLQDRYGPKAVRGISAILAEQIEAVGFRFRYRPLQQEMEAARRRLATTGDLVALAKLVDDPETQQRDQRAFDAARNRYQGAVAEIERLEAARPMRPQLAHEAGRRQAAAVSCTGAALALAGLFIIWIV